MAVKRVECPLCMVRDLRRLCAGVPRNATVAFSVVDALGEAVDVQPNGAENPPYQSRNPITTTIVTVLFGPPMATSKSARIVRALNVRKGHTFSHLDKSMKFGTDDLHAILFQNFDGSNLRC